MSVPVQAGEEIFPSCNLHSFIFSNPFSSSSRLVETLKTTGDNAIFPKISPHKPIFYDSNTSAAITHSRLRRDTLLLAHGIHQRFGIPQTTEIFGKGSLAGPVVLIHLPNCIAWPVLALGFLAAGWTITGTNPKYTATELAHIIKQCEPRAVICDPGSGGENVVREACTTAGHGNVDILLVDHQSEVYGAPRKAPVKHSWTALLSDRELQVSPLTVEEANQRVAFIMWTSGTTGSTKGAMMSHHAIVAGLIQLWHGNPRYSTDEIWIAVAPFYHIFGLYNQLLLAPCIGATIIVMQKFNLEEYLRITSDHRATHMHIAPPIAVALAKSELLRQPWCSLDAVTAATAGGAPLSPEVIQEVWKRINVVIKMGYGLTETGGVTSMTGNSWDAVEPQLGTCGTPFLGIHVSIIGEDGKPMTAKEPGEIIIRSPAQMIGYLNNPKATTETLDEKGVHTGDVGYIDEQGNIRIVDRIKELIKYKGFQVSPTELESVIAALPEVHDVAVSSIYSNSQGTELPLAYVVPRPPALLQHLSSEAKTPKELVALADKIKLSVERNCVHYKYLRGGITFIPAIPKSPSGKTLRRLLKDQHGVHIDCYGATGRSKL